MASGTSVRLAFIFLVSTLVTLVPAGCNTGHTEPAATQPADPPTQPAPATPIAEKKQELGSDKTWDPQWDLIVEKQIPPDMLSPQAAQAVRTFCPRFAQESEAEKRAFWAYTFQALAGAEAGLNPTSDVHHTAAPVNKRDAVTSHLSRQ